jgi:hypothetical protein
MKTQPIENPGYNSIMTLDNVTRLRMAKEQEVQAAPVMPSYSVAQREPNGAATSKEAVAVFVMITVFTALFWVAISYLRSL